MNAVKKLNTFQQRVLRRMHKIIPDRPAAIAMFWKPQRGKRNIKDDRKLLGSALSKKISKLSI